MTRNLTAAVLTVLLFAHATAADVLWDRSGFDPFGPGYFNVEAGSPPFGMTWYTVNHVTVGGSWTIDSITTYYSNLDPAWGTGITTGYLHVFSKTGSLPIDGTDDPGASPIVTMSATLELDHWRVIASGLNLNLAPGEYWIGTTPIAPSGPFGPEIHLASMLVPTGDDSASYDAFGFPAPMWFDFNPGVEASILIEGTEQPPVSVENGSFGSVKALYR